MRLKEYLINENIYADNHDDPTNPEVLVTGVGRYELNQVIRNVKNKLEDLNAHAAKAETADDWKKIRWMLNHAAMAEMVNTIITAREELEERKIVEGDTPISEMSDQELADYIGMSVEAVRANREGAEEHAREKAEDYGRDNL
jgi:hypothetical protein